MKTWLIIVGGVALNTTLANDLPQLSLHKSFTVSGLSSGAYMAGQFHLAHADGVDGVALLAGGPYNCADNSLMTALGQCVDKGGEKIDVKQLVANTKQRSSDGQLATFDSYSHDRVWLFHGTADKRVARNVADAAHQFYQQLSTTITVRYITDKSVAHVFPTQAQGGDCTESVSPFVSACQYDAAAELLSFLLPDQSSIASSGAGQLMTFDQGKYASDNTLADTGYVYVPANCKAGQICRLHIAFHGCQQNADSVGTAFVEKAGYNAWADTHNVVVLYPQTKASMMPLNPKACWDWWGYTGADYATKNGKQIQHVANMVKALRK